MPYDNLIDRTDAGALIPEEVSREIFKEMGEENPLFQLARKLPNMSRAQQRMPVASAMATAYFVDGDVGLEQTTSLEWANKYIDAEEIAAIIPVPKKVLYDQDYDLWGEAKPNLVDALNKAIIQAAFYGTNIPASWTTNLGAAGLVALCTTNGKTVSIAGFADLYEAIMGESADGAADGLLMLLEAQGYLATGHIAHPLMKGRFRNCRSIDGVPLFTPATGGSPADLDGARVFFPRDGSGVAGSSLDIAGDWRKLVYSYRQDIEWELSSQAVITDAAGKVVLNLFQQNAVALKATVRMGFALPNPITPMATGATRTPFAILTA